MNEHRRQTIRAEIHDALAGKASGPPVDLLFIAMRLAERHGPELSIAEYKEMARVEADFLGVDYTPLDRPVTPKGLHPR